MKKYYLKKIIFTLVLSLFIMGMKGQTIFSGVQQLPEELLTTDVTEESRKSIMRTAKVQSYIERGPISISSDFQLNNSGFAGNGTIDDPIRIEGYNITYSSGDSISITGTTFHFRIVNCFLNGLNSADQGISLTNVMHSTVENNTVMNTRHSEAFAGSGILLDSSKNNTISNNIVFNHSLGIRLTSISENNRIINNTVYNTNYKGISLHTSSNNSMDDNLLFNNNEAGIDVDSSSNNNLIIRNSIYNNAYGGIGISSSKDNRVFTNSVYNTGGDGIMLVDDADNNTIGSNIVYNNKGYGIKLGYGAESDDNKVEMNDFSGNNAGNSQAYDDGTSNVFTYNHWKDLVGTGTYSIDGPAGNQDLSPLTNPYHISPPVIAAITLENLTITNNWTIQWEESADTFGHALSYSVFYSTNDGTSWIALVSNLKTTGYTLDTTDIADGTLIRLKIQAIDSVGFVAQVISSETFLILNNLTPPAIIYPNGGETLKEIVTVTWEESQDPLNHLITYTIYYSANNGAMWTQLASGVTSTSYSWNTTSLSNGLSYLIKIVATCTAGKTSEDISDAVFSIENDIPMTTTTTTTLVPGMTWMVLLGTLVMLRIMRKKKGSI